MTLYAWVTALARLTMLGDMQKLQRLGARIYYSDTDSVIFDAPKRLGKKALSEMFNIGSKAYGGYKFEIEGEILSCVIAGPKNYALRHSDPRDEVVREMVKIRGFSLTNPAAVRKLNHSSMKETLSRWWMDGEVEIIETENFSMKVDRKKQTVKNATVVKKYRNDGFDKRWIDPESLRENKNLCTVPFGARHARYSDVCE